MVKIKLNIPQTVITENGESYSLKRGDVAEIPRKKAEQLINLNMALNVSGGGCDGCV